MSAGLRDQLQEIYDKHGKLTTTLLIDTAQPKDHPLHDRLEWDDSIAGVRWRHHQAHELIRSVKIVHKDADGKPQGPEVRVFHAIRGNEGFVYEPVERIVDDPFLTKLLLADMEREWRTLQSRYDKFQEFWALVNKSVKAKQANQPKKIAS